VAVAKTLRVNFVGDTKNLDGGLAKVSAGFGALAKRAAAATAVVGAAVAGVAVKGVKDFAAFDQQMNEVFTLLPGISKKAMADMTGQVKQFSKDFGVLPEKVIPALYQALSAGVPQKNVFTFLETAQKAAKGGVTDLETAVDGISSTVNAYGQDVISAAQASDLMFTAVKLGKTDFEQLSKSLFNVNPVAAGLGVKFQDVTAALAALTSQGVPTSVATTQMRQLFVELSKAGGKTATVFEEIAGKTFKQFIAEGGNTQDALKLLEKHAKNTGVGVQDLFGSVEAGGAALALTGKGTDKFSDALDGMAGAAGATDAAFQQMNRGIGPAFDRIKASLAVMSIEIGERLAPKVSELAAMIERNMPMIQRVVGSAFDAIIDSIDFVISGIDDIITAFNRVKGFIQNNLRPILIGLAALLVIFGPHFTALGVVATINAAKVAAAWVVTQVSAVKAAVVHSAQVVKMVAGWVAIAASATFNAAKVVAGWVLMGTQSLINGARMAAAWIAAMGPVAWVIATVVALAALIIANWDKIVAWTKKAWNAVSGVVTAAWDWITRKTGEAWNWITTKFQQATAFVKGIWDRFWNGVNATAQSIWNAISGFFTRAFEAYRQLFIRVWTGIRDFFTGIWTGIRNSAVRIWTGIRDFFGGALEGFVGFWQRQWSRVVNGFRRTFEGVKGIAVNIWNGIGGLFRRGVNAVIRGVNWMIRQLNKIPGVNLGEIGLWAGPPVLKLRDGGPVVGPGTETSDSINARLSRGEHVLSAKEVRGLGGHQAVEEMRERARRGRMLTAEAADSLSGRAERAQETVGFTKAVNAAGRAFIAGHAPSFDIGRAARVWGSRIGFPIKHGIAPDLDLQMVVKGYSNPRSPRGWYGITGNAADMTMNLDRRGTYAQNLMTLVHEMGHVFGLNHTRDRSSIMYPGRSSDFTPNAADVRKVQARFGPAIAKNRDDSSDRGVFSSVWNFLKGMSPLAWIRNLRKKVIERIRAAMPEGIGQFGNIGIGLLKQSWDGIKKWALDKIGLGGGGGIGNRSGPGGWQWQMEVLRRQFPGLQLISGFRPGAITATGNRSYHALGRAVDVPPQMDVFEYIRRVFGAATKELIFSPAGGRQIWNGRNHFYTGITRANHWDHIHWAMANGGLVTSPTMALLGEDGDEAIVPLTKPRRAKQVMDQAGIGGDKHYHLTVYNAANNEIDLRAQFRRMELLESV
jgi:TP901 family phage tail tape measure protein